MNMADSLSQAEEQGNGSGTSKPDTMFRVIGRVGVTTSERPFAVIARFSNGITLTPGIEVDIQPQSEPSSQ